MKIIMFSDFIDKFGEKKEKCWILLKNILTWETKFYIFDIKIKKVVEFKEKI